MQVTFRFHPIGRIQLSGTLSPSIQFYTSFFGILFELYIIFVQQGGLRREIRLEYLFLCCILFECICFINSRCVYFWLQLYTLSVRCVLCLQRYLVSFSLFSASVQNEQRKSTVNVVLYLKLLFKKKKKSLNYFSNFQYRKNYFIFLFFSNEKLKTLLNFI